MPLRRSSGQTFASPSSRTIRSLDIQHTDNLSLHDAGAAVASNSASASTSASAVNTSYSSRQESLMSEQKVVSSIVSRLVNKVSKHRPPSFFRSPRVSFVCTNARQTPFPRQAVGPNALRFRTRESSCTHAHKRKIDTQFGHSWLTYFHSCHATRESNSR